MLPLQAGRCEELGLRRFGRTKIDPRKHPAAKVLSAAEQQALLETTLDSHAADSRQYLRGARTQGNVERANADFEAFLHQFRGHPAGTWLACTPELVLAYLRTDVAGRRGRRGTELSASTLRQHVSNLSMCFSQRGRKAAWDELAAVGNPVLSQLVREHVEVIERRQHASGVRARSAVPCPRADIQRLLRTIDAQREHAAAVGNQLEQLRCLRDACLVALLWHSSRRAADLLRLTWGHVYVAQTTELACAYWARSAGVPDAIMITADVLKNAKRSRPLTITVSSESAGSAAFCAVRRLQRLRAAAIDLDSQTHGTTGFLFPSYKTVQPPRTAISSAGFANRFKTFVAAAGQPGEASLSTVHGIRRGRMQHEAAHGTPFSDILLLAGIRTESVGRVYLDPGRHLP